MITYAIGDVHGCLKTLEVLMSEIGEWDRLVFLGDYIDRGRFSKEVIDYIMLLEKRYGKDKVIALIGNHEDMCLHAHQRYDYSDHQLGRAWHYNGAHETLASYPERKVTERHLEWMLGLGELYEDDNAIYVHAGLMPECDTVSTCRYDKLWIRNEFLASNYDFGKPVIHGHSAMKKADVTKNRISIDTGCVYGYSLTAYCTESGKVISVPVQEGDTCENIK